MAGALPALFLSHGSPTICVEDNATTRFWAGWLNRHQKPRAILVVSAHWETEGLRVTAWERCPIVHDFSGFPEALYRLDYPAPGAPGVAEEVRAACRAAGLGEVALDGERGLDHGAWVPLTRMFPAADVPVVQLSLPKGWPPERLYELGRALAPLRGEGILLIGSGGATHNLAAIDPDATEVARWARVFETWLREMLDDWNLRDLFEYWQVAPHGVQAHPSEEHFLPLFLPMGAGEAKRQATIKHDAFMYGSLSMLAVEFR